MSTIYELAQRAPYTLIVGTAPTINQSLDWTARSVRIDNFSNQTVYLDDADTYVPTKTFGMIIPIVANRALASFKAPPMSPDPAPVNGQICRVTFFEDELHPSPGFTPAASLSSDGATLQRLGLSADPGAAGLAADAAHRHPFPFIDAARFGSDDVAMLAAIAALPAPQGGTILLDPSVAWQINNTVSWSDRHVCIVGAGSGSQPGTGTLINVKAGVTGFNPLNGVNGFGARSRFEGFRMVSASVAAGVDDGILGQCNEGQIRDVVIEHFGGRGVNLDSTAADIAHNADGWQAQGVRCYKCFSDGWHTVGPNSNAGLFAGLDMDTNGGFGIFEQGALGNTYLAPQLAGNAGGGARLGVGGSNSRAFGTYYESQNLPALQIDLNNQGGNSWDFIDCSRPDGANPVADYSGLSTNFWRVNAGGIHWNRLTVKQSVAATGYGLLDLIGEAAIATLLFGLGAQWQMQNAGNTANWFGQVLPDNSLRIQSAQGAPFHVLGPSVGTFDAGVGLETVGHNHGHTHGPHAHTVPITVGVIATQIGLDGSGNLVMASGPNPAIPVAAATPATDSTAQSADHTHKG